MNQEQVDIINSLQQELLDVVKPSTVFAVFNYDPEQGIFPAGDELGMSVVSTKYSRMMSVTKGVLQEDLNGKEPGSFCRLWSQAISRPVSVDRQLMLRVTSTPGSTLFSPRAGKLRIKHTEEGMFQVCVGKYRMDNEEIDDVIAVFSTRDVQYIEFLKARYTGYDTTFGPIKPGDKLLRFSPNYKDKEIKFTLSDRGPTGLPVIRRPTTTGPIWDLVPDRIIQIYHELIACAKAAYAPQAGYGRVTSSYMEINVDDHDPSEWVDYDKFGGDIAIGERELASRSIPLGVELDEKFTSIEATNRFMIPLDIVNDRGRNLGKWRLDLREATIIDNRFAVMGAIPYPSTGKVSFGVVRVRLPVNKMSDKTVSATIV